MKFYKLCVFCGAVFAALFSLLNVFFGIDIAALAFPLSAAFNAFLFYIIFAGLLKSPKRAAFSCAKKLLQYQPFVHLIAFIVRRAGSHGTTFWFDAVSVFLWLFSFASSSLLLYCMNERRVKKINPEWEGICRAQKRRGALWLLFEVLDWADALVQAVFMVLLFQIFFFQFYKIPSESMVPELLIKDRLMVSKITSGPKFPLTNVGLPCLKKYKRGDIVVFRNPHYSSGRTDEVKSVVSELVYMLTFTTVNMNVDENGEVKADPLVKRVTGVGGEQLMMVDGVLYSRTKESPQWLPVKEDASWASYDLNAEDDSLKAGIHEFPISAQGYQQMVSLEKERAALDVQKTRAECERIAKSLVNLSGYKNLPPASAVRNFISDADLWELNLLRENYALTVKVLSSASGVAWFQAFMTDWIRDYEKNESNGLFGGDLYSDSNFRLNLMMKRTIGNFVLRNAELMARGVSSADFAMDSGLQQCWRDAENLHNYSMYLDRRNMCVFPKNNLDGSPSYIPEGSYFMMGDNRFNSLDMRHRYEETLERLCPADAFSVLYYSNLEPQFVPQSRILGTTEFRFWPKNRIGRIGARRPAGAK